MIRTVMLAAILFSSSAALAQQDFSSGNFMLKHCKHFVTDNFAYDVWDGDCGGVVGTYLFLGNALPDGFKICKPKGVTQAQAALVAVRYMEQRPAELNQPYYGLILSALSEAWPCKK